MTDAAPFDGQATSLRGDPSARLEAAYRAIRDERMRGVPILNPALDVAAVGFAPWAGHWLGVMVTPWFMNLMLVPRDPEAWRPVANGMKHTHPLPSGEYEFIGGCDSALGEYQMCSLFSPMSDFADMDTAKLTAKLALAAVLDPAHADSDRDADAPRGDGLPAPRELAAGDHGPTVSKRDFLRGAFLRRGDRG